MSSDLVPGLTVVRTYKLRWFPKDLVAGLILTTLLVPQGMAYAELAGLPPITGLYTSILCLATYAVFGPSKILVLGPDSSLGPMIAATILPLVGANGDSGRRFRSPSPARARARTSPGVVRSKPLPIRGSRRPCRRRCG